MGYGEAGLTVNERIREKEFELLTFNRRKSLYKEALASLFYNSGIVKAEKLTIHTLKNISLTHNKTAEDNVYPPPPRDINKLSQETWRTYLINIETVRHWGKENKFDTLFYWQSMVCLKSNKTSQEEKFAKSWFFLKPYHLKMIDLINKSDYKNENKNFHDLSYIFDNDSQACYVDFCHLNPYGEKKVAARIARDVIPILQKKMRTRKSP